MFSRLIIMLSIVFSFFLLIGSASSHTIFKYSIEEKSPVNTIVADFSKELNLKSSGTFRLYELLPSNENLFSIDHRSGQLRAQSRLDREQMCFKRQCSCQSCVISLQLIVETSERILSKIVEITIRDLNDHSPSFDHQSMTRIIHIKENVPLGYRIVLPSASDPDEGSNAVQSYRLHGASADDFDVDFSSFDVPYLIVRSSLDRQRQSSYSLTLVAADHGDPSRSDSIQLDVQILSINQSVPTFLQSVYNIDIREDTVIGTTILNIEAISENDEKIFYELLTESPFIIDRLTGQIQLSKSLDYERDNSYRLTVKAFENAIPAYASIFIRVIDINDNSVSMRIKVEGNTTLRRRDNDKNVLFIPENTPIGTTIAHVILHDLDSFTNGNPYLQLRTGEPPLPLIYKLIYQTNFQNIKLYSLILHYNLDRESKSLYDNIQFLAHDSGTPTLHTQLVLTLNITDVNDCTPQLLTNSTIYHVNENNLIGALVAKLTAYDCDLDENARVEYRLLNQTDLLILDSNTGEMRLNQSVDFELWKRSTEKNVTTIDFEFLIELRDHGQPPLSNRTKITLRIHDINDHSPEFDRNQSYNWTHSKAVLQPGAILGRISASDADSGVSGLIHYSIRSFNPCLTLNITSLGFIYIPYEFASLTCSLTSYTFEITATDDDPVDPRSTMQLLTLTLHSHSASDNVLPKLLPLSLQRTTIDTNTHDDIVFVLDIATVTNHTYQPRVYLNSSNLLACWNISSSGELRLVAHPIASSYLLTFNVIDEYTEDQSVHQLQVDICNSSISNSCQFLRSSDNRMVLIYAISLALSITFASIVIFSIVICLCCRKTGRREEKLASTHHHSFLQYNDDYNNEKIDNASDQYKSSSDSTIRDDDHDSACIVNGHSSASTTSSSNDTWYNRRESTIQMHPPLSTYQYDLKLAELLRKNQHPPCIYLNDLPPIPQSSSTDYGFSSLNLSKSSSTSTIPNQPHETFIDRSANMKSFISTHECVV